jgi:uncharacterized protein GlcG (DUF336 family)
MTLTLKAVQRMLDAAIQKAESIQIRIAVAIVDAGGHVILKARMDGAWFLTADICEGKAYTAVALQRTTEQFAEKVAVPRPQFYAGLAALSEGKLIAAGGGVPITQKGEMVGAIGVSGGTPEQDIECATAGLATL